MKKKILILSLAIIVLLPLALFLRSNNWFQKNEETKPEENLSTSTENIIDEEKVTKQNLVAEYLENNISELSPEKEVLGGKFYLTSIDFVSDNQAVATYEDGHIALTANIIFSVKQNDSQENEVVIENFEIVKD